MTPRVRLNWFEGAYTRPNEVRIPNENKVPNFEKNIRKFLLRKFSSKEEASSEEEVSSLESSSQETCYSFQWSLFKRGGLIPLLANIYYMLLIAAIKLTLIHVTQHFYQPLSFFKQSCGHINIFEDSKTIKPSSGGSTQEPPT